MSESKNRLQGLVFDLDDTLYCQADYKRSGFNAVAEWLEKCAGLDAHQTRRDLEDILQYKGPSYPNVFDDFVEMRGLSPEWTDALVTHFIDHQPQLRCYPGVEALLAELRNRYRLGILSDGRQSSQAKKLAALQLENKVDAVLLSDSLGLCKPAEQLFQWFEDQFQLKGTQLAYIGDNPGKDFLGANRRNWLTIRVRTGEHAALPAAGEYRAQIDLPRVTNLTAWLTQHSG